VRKGIGMFRMDVGDARTWAQTGPDARSRQKAHRKCGAGVWTRTFVAAGLLAGGLLGGCSSEKHATCPLPSGFSGGIAIVTTDNMTGSIAIAGDDSSGTIYRELQPIHSDAVARVFRGLLYVVNRLGGDNIQVLDPGSCFNTIKQFSVGPGSNPHDIAVLSRDRAYVSCNGTPYLLQVNPTTGAIRDSISLATLADSDGNPDMDRLFYRDPYLYVAVDRIDFTDVTYPPVPPSYLAVIDTRADTLVDTDPARAGTQAITLQGLNPCAPMVWDEAEQLLLVPEVGEYGVLDGGIEKIDLSTWRSAGWLVHEGALGGDLTDFAILPGVGGYATVAWNGTTSLVTFDLATGLDVRTLYHSDGYDLADLLVVPSTELLFVCDRNTEASGLRLYNAATGLPVAGIRQPVPTGLPPFELVAMQ
jgi:hypothetical protein